jgi:hypothetical protein
MELLGDIEKDIDGDWKDIYDKIQKENEWNSMSEPVIPDFPSYDEFYETVLSCLYNDDPESRLPVNFLHLLHRVVRNQDRKQDRKKPKSFDKVWEFFCDPHRYKIEQHECNCGASYTAIFKRSNISSYSLRYRYSYEMEEISISQKDVYCIDCGRPFLSVANDELVGLFGN